MLRISKCITQCSQYSAVREEAQVARQSEQRAIGGHRALVHVSTMFDPIDYYSYCMCNTDPALGTPWSSPLGEWWWQVCLALPHGDQLKHCSSLHPHGTVQGSPPSRRHANLFPRHSRQVCPIAVQGLHHIKGTLGQENLAKNKLRNKHRPRYTPHTTYHTHPTTNHF